VVSYNDQFEDYMVSITNKVCLEFEPKYQRVEEGLEKYRKEFVGNTDYATLDLTAKGMNIDDHYKTHFKSLNQKLIFNSKL